VKKKLFNLPAHPKRGGIPQTPSGAEEGRLDTKGEMWNDSKVKLRKLVKKGVTANKTSILLS